MKNTNRVAATLSLLLTLLTSGAGQAVAEQTETPLSQQKKRLTHEAMWLMKRVGAPAVSPDGRWAVFSVTNPAYDEKEQATDLWIASTDGTKKPRQITFNNAAESDVTWSSDSARIAFTAKREGDEVAQIYVLDVAGGGEAQRITNVSTGARSPQFSPRGDSILFSSVVHPAAADDEANRKAAKERKEQKQKVRVYESFPIRNWDRWLDDMQVHILVQPARAGEKARDILAGTKLVAEPGFGGRTVEGSREEIDAAWSPDSNSIIFAATTTRTSAAYAQVANNLYRTAPNGGEPERIAGGDGLYRSPRFTPDGKTLLTIFNPNSGKVYDLDRLVAFDWPSMKNRRVITASTDRSAGSFAVSPDSRTIYFTAEDAGLEKIYSVPVSGGEVRLAVDPRRGVLTDLQIAPRAASVVMVARYGSSIEPAEVVRVEVGGGKFEPLTSFAVDQAKAIDWQPPVHFWFTSSRGKKIHNFIVLPPNFDEKKKYPLLVLIHGGPATMFRDQISLRWNYHLLAAPGYVLLMTNYTGSTGFGEKFAQEIQGDPFKGPADEINEAADEAIRRFPFIDASRQAAAGASYGGHLVNWLQGNTTRYKAFISHAGLIDSESQWGTSDTIFSRELMNLGPVWEQGEVWRTQNPIRYAKNFRTPTLLSIGEKDFRVPLNQTIEYWSVLQRLRIPSKLLVWPEENHWILNGENSRFFYREVADWLGRWVK